MAQIVNRFVEVCIFRFSGEHAEYLVLHRQPLDLVYPNTWQFVTGSIDPGETALEAAKRELEEETGFTPRALWVLPMINSFYDVRHDVVHLDPVFAAQVDPGATPRLSHEHDDFLWMSRPEAVRRLLWRGQQEALELVHRAIVGGEEVMRVSRII